MAKKLCLVDIYGLKNWNNIWFIIFSHFGAIFYFFVKFMGPQRVSGKIMKNSPSWSVEMTDLEIKVLNMVLYFSYT